MLLLMIQSNLNQRSGTLIRNFEVAQHGFVNVRAIGVNLIQARTRHQSARAAIGMRSKLLVVGIEKLLVSGIEGFIPGSARAKDESLEKPGGVRQMPFCRATVRH